MAKNSQIDHEEINLIGLMLTVWEGKWNIAVVIFISFITAISYQSIQKKNFTAITQIKPVSSLEINKYIPLNNIIEITNTNFQFGKITKSNLLNFYVDILHNKSIFEDAMHKFNLLEASQYNNDQEYNEAIINLASSVKILTPDKNKEGYLEISYDTINFIYDDSEKWKNALIYVDELANQIVNKTLLDDYNSTLSFLKQNQEYQLKNLKTLMTNTQIDFDKEMKKFEMNREFQLEDIQTKIDNAFLDYDRKTADKLAFLGEQASIARKLEIAKSTIEAQTFAFDNRNIMVANIKTDVPFYLLGYEAIEKEIELILARDDKQAFVIGLYDLEQEKRSLEQDRTLLRAEKNKVFLDSLIKLEKKQRLIEEDKTIERIELAFQLSPLGNNNEFYATSKNVLTTKFIYKDNEFFVVAIVIIGLIAGIFYVFISNAFQFHRVSKKKN